MNEQEKKDYLERYQQAKEKGVPFFPDILFKDAVVSLIVFLLLVGLAFFVGAALEERADPADTTYTPRPEWYFLFLFQLLKYFPGNLEVLGVVVIPTIAVILLFLLPLLDTNSRRHFSGRPIWVGITAVMGLGVIILTILSYLEAPPPAEAAEGDRTAALYASNCAGCHGASISIASGVNLHEIIAQGRHEDMPAWSADLTTDQIDALAGFILSPKGSQIFTRNCGDCHEAPELVAEDPLELRTALQSGITYPPHSDLDIPHWSEELDQDDFTALINFLIAPDGQRLFSVNCSPCHGFSVPFAGGEDELLDTIRQGGMHLEMPPWQEKLSPSEIDLLTRYVIDPSSITEGQQLFQQNCESCHGERVPMAEEFYATRDIIRSGGSHQEMPVWGDVLTAEQMDALVSYAVSAAKGTPLEVGQDLYAANCANCHGEFGEGGANPARIGDIIAPISSAEYLSTRDDFTLRTIISQGQPNFGMSPFSSGFGGPLDDEEIDAIIAFLRSWEENPPVELPPEVAIQQVSLSGPEIYAELCAQCHGEMGEGDVGTAFNDPQFQDSFSDEEIFDTINGGHQMTSMIAWGEILSAQQIQQLVVLIRQMATEPAPTSVGVPSFANEILPIFEAHCNMCHGQQGGWDGTSYQSVMNTGIHAPVIIPGDPLNSLLAQKLLGTQTIGTIMPTAGKLPETLIQLIIDWIAGGAPNN